LISRLSKVVTAAVFLTWTSSAFAWEPEQVRLKNGGAVRGQLVERVPNVHVILKLATGEIRTIEWKDIATTESAPPSAEESSAPAAPPFPPQAREPEHGPPPLTDATTARIHFTSDVPTASLEMLDVEGKFVDPAHAKELASSGRKFMQLCEGACDTTTSSLADLRVDAGGTPTALFRVDAGAANVEFRGASAGRHAAAVPMLALGSIGAIMGGLFVGVAFATATKSTYYDPQTLATTTTSTPNTPILVTGLVIGGLGVVLAAIGIPLFATSRAKQVLVNGAALP
jgi:hypothetical protein